MASIMGMTRNLATIPIRIIKTPFTVARQLRSMTSESSIVGQARRAFVEDAKGRAKAILGFVVGDDRLLTTGQIERTKAQERMTAVAEEAAADAIERRADEQAGIEIEDARRAKAEADRKERARKAKIARETAQEQQRIEAEAAAAKRAVEAEAAGEEVVIDATELAVEVEAARDLAAAEAEELAASEARAEAEAIERARKEARAAGRS